jgi:excisionase family DNA binding protein
MQSESMDRSVLTLEEVAEFLRLSKELLEREIRAGFLPVLQFESESRILRTDFEQYLKSKSTRTAGISTSPIGFRPINFTRGKEFEYRWPMKRTESSPKKKLEQFTEVYDGASDGKRIKIAFSDRADRPGRIRATVFVDNRPMVRFKPADDFPISKLMLSVIKTADRKQLRPEDLIPPEYALFQVASYRKHINSLHASRNMAVICHKDDFQTMAQHALIRASQIEKRNA